MATYAVLVCGLIELQRGTACRYQSNTERRRIVLSLLCLGLQVWKREYRLNRPPWTLAEMELAEQGPIGRAAAQAACEGREFVVIHQD